MTHTCFDCQSTVWSLGSKVHRAGFPTTHYNDR